MIVIDVKVRYYYDLILFIFWGIVILINRWRGEIIIWFRVNFILLYIEMYGEKMSGGSFLMMWLIKVYFYEKMVDLVMLILFLIIN